MTDVTGVSTPRTDGTTVPDARLAMPMESGM